MLLAIAVAATGPDAPTIAVCVAIAAVCVLWLVRAARAGVDLRDDGVVVRGVLWTRTFPWARVERAFVVPVRGRTTLALQLSDGKVRHIEELAATGRAAEVVVFAASEISRRRDATRR